jgi:hypothetical protein
MFRLRESNKIFASCKKSELIKEVRKFHRISPQTFLLGANKTRFGLGTCAKIVHSTRGGGRLKAFYSSAQDVILIVYIARRATCVA